MSTSSQKPIPFFLASLAFLFTPEKLLMIGITLNRPVLVKLAIFRGANASAYSYDEQKNLLDLLPTAHKDFGYFTPLHHAAYMGSPEICTYLVQKGSDINKTNFPGLTPLHMAVLQDDIPTAQALIQTGADPNKSGQDGHTPLHWAAISRHVSENMFRFLVADAKADINQPDENGYSPLYTALSYRNTTTADILLELGARHDLRTNKSKHTALHFAAGDDSLSIITKKLLIKGARINAQDRFGETPLHRAVKQDAIENTDLLLTNAANPNAPDHDRETTLMQAKSEHILALLLKFGGNPNQVDKNGKSVLMHQCQKQGHVAQVDILVKAGADVNHAATDGTTALMHACQQQSQEIVDILVANHADPDVMDEAHKTAFDYLFTSTQAGIAASLRKKARPAATIAPAPTPKEPC